MLASKIKPVNLDQLLRAAEEVYSLEELKTKLASGRQLRIKFGADVTAPFLHIGHAVNLWMMRTLQNCGHKVVFLIGDFTTRIGDPTDKSETRRVVSEKEIEKNAKEFIKQVGLVLRTDRAVFEIRRNSEWYGRMRLADFLPLLAQVTHAKLIQRDMFQKRIAEGREIHLHEMIYPVLQGHDSVMLKSDLTIVGSDQLFNELMGRFFQEKHGQKPQIVITTKITPGLDGVEKQSKSLGNYIALTDTPSDKFGKLMSVPDSLIIPYAEVYTELPMDSIHGMEKEIAAETLNPMDAKKRVAAAVVTRYHGQAAAREAQEQFENTFQKKKLPQDVKTIYFDPRNAPMMVDASVQAKIVPSKSEWKRLIEQGGIELDGAKISKDIPTADIKDNAILRVGKKRFFRVRKPK